MHKNLKLIVQFSVDIPICGIQNIGGEKIG